MDAPYSEETISDVLAFYDTLGGPGTRGALARTIKQFNIPGSTIRGWFKRAEEMKNRVVSSDKDDLIARLRAKKEGLLKDELRKTSLVLLAFGDEIVTALHDKIKGMTVEELISTLRAIAYYEGVTADRLSKLDRVGAGVPADPVQGRRDGFMEKAFGVPAGTA